MSAQEQVVPLPATGNRFVVMSEWSFSIVKGSFSHHYSSCVTPYKVGQRAVSLFAVLDWVILLSRFIEYTCFGSSCLASFKSLGLV